MRVRVAALTDTGQKRAVNEDSLGVFEAERLFVVSDGMGGHAGGQMASSITVDSIKKYFICNNSDEDGSPDPGKLQQSIEFANEMIFDAARENREYQGMGATVVALWLESEQAVICHVGDSRVYLLRDNELKQITQDHSLVAELLRRKELTPEEAEFFPHKNVITRALGRREVQVDTTKRRCREGDFFLLCSDGLTNMVKDSEIREVVLDNRDSLDWACRRLVDLANERGGLDNITVLIVNVSLGG